MANIAYHYTTLAGLYGIITSKFNLVAIYLSMIYFIKNEYWNEENEIRLLYDDSN